MCSEKMIDGYSGMKIYMYFILKQDGEIMSSNWTSLTEQEFYLKYADTFRFSKIIRVYSKVLK